MINMLGGLWAAPLFFRTWVSGQPLGMRKYVENFGAQIVFAPVVWYIEITEMTAKQSWGKEVRL